MLVGGAPKGTTGAVLGSGLLLFVVPTMVLAQQGWPSWSLLLVTLVGGTLAAGGANAINMVVDRDIDKLMPRTQGRP